MDSNDILNNKNDDLNSIKSKASLDNIKSNYFFLKIFEYTKKNKILEIIKYNKKLQKILNISINNYIEYSELYSSIEIEIIPLAEGKFINIPTEEQEHYHIYFNDKREEVKDKTFILTFEKIKKINIIIDYKVKSFASLFYLCYAIRSLTFKKFCRNNIIDMNHMFHGCFCLGHIDFSNFNTNNVTNMEYLFSGCENLEKLDLSNFNTNNVVNMEQMFCGCSSLKELNISNFNTNNVTNMSGMFLRCNSLKELNLSNFDIHNVKKMYGMFYRCSSLKDLSFPNLKIKNEQNIDDLFKGCSNDLKENILKRYKV